MLARELGGSSIFGKVRGWAGRNDPKLLRGTWREGTSPRQERQPGAGLDHCPRNDLTLEGAVPWKPILLLRSLNIGDTATSPSNLDNSSTPRLPKASFFEFNFDFERHEFARQHTEVAGTTGQGSLQNEWPLCLQSRQPWPEKINSHIRIRILFNFLPSQLQPPQTQTPFDSCRSRETTMAEPQDDLMPHDELMQCLKRYCPLYPPL